MKKKYLNYILTFALFLGFGVIQANAQFSGGTGAEADPYLITTAQQLNDIRDNASSYFQLQNDIDLSGWISGNSDPDIVNNGWAPISGFSGGLDGNGSAIKNIWMNHTTGIRGLFSTINGATIKKVGVIIDPAKSIKGNGRVGALVGQIPLGALPVFIEECYVIGKVESTADRAGGLVGDIKGDVTIKKCYSNGIVEGVDRVGGIVGGIQLDANELTSNTVITIEECYSASEIVSTANEKVIAGIIGHAYWHSTTVPFLTLLVKNCLGANISITAPDAVRQGNHRRILGWSTDSDLILSDNKGYTETVFIAGEKISDSGGRHGADISETDIVLQTSYSTWDFANTWQMHNGNYQLPVLKNLNLTNQPQSALPHIDNLATATDGIKEAEKLFDYSNGVIHLIDKSASVSVLIYALSGSKILETHNSIIDISGFSKGIYLVKVGSVAFKIIR